MMSMRHNQQAVPSASLLNARAREAPRMHVARENGVSAGDGPRPTTKAEITTLHPPCYVPRL
jgi:hypothetical protein